MAEPDEALSLYEKVWTELEEGSMNRGLWALCFAEVDGDTEKAKARYIKARVAQLARADEARREGEMERMREKQRVEREQQERQRREAEAAAHRLRDEQAREEAERQARLREERAREERRKGLHGPQQQEEQEEADFEEIIEAVRVRNRVNRTVVEDEKVDHWGCTRLMRAAQAGRYEEVLQMVADGDDATRHDSSGMSARAHADVRGHDKCARFLEVAERVQQKRRDAAS